MPTLTNASVLSALQSKFNEQIMFAEEPYGMLSVTIKHASILDVMTFLKEDADLNFHFLTTCCGLHFPDQPEEFGMMYQLHNMPENFRFRLKAWTKGPDPVFPSLVPLWRSANWMERETYDFFGFKFTGHPDLRRILNMDSLEGWPMRKEYPLEDPFRKDKDDKMFGR